MDIEIPPKLVKCTRTAWRNNRNSVREEFLQDILKSQKIIVPQEFLIAI